MSGAHAVDLKKSTFYLNGLGCANCAAKIENKIHENMGFDDVNFSFATKKLQLKSDMGEAELLSTIQGIVDSIEDGVTVDLNKACAPAPSCADDGCTGHGYSHDHAHSHESVKKESKIIGLLKQHIRMIIGTILVFTIIIAKPAMTIAIPGYFISYLLIGSDVATRAIKNLMKGNLFDEYFLMTIATVGAFALGEYTEAVMVMFFYKLGEGFQDYAVDYSRRSIQSLLDIKAEYANLIIDGNARRVAPENLKTGDMILIKAGEKIPVDGIAVEGHSSLDTSALTGESLPRTVDTGDEVLSGCINQEGVLKVEVTKTYENSAVARILDMVENATGKKAKTEQFITKFSKVYTPIVVIAAAVLAFIPPLIIGGDFREWISRALIFLVISCPCALVLSVPLGYFAGLGVASREGILIKGGNYLEALNTIDTFVFDKTGTLTKGNFSVQHVIGAKTLELAAVLEQHSNHPIAQSIIEAYGKNVPSDSAVDVAEQPGEGLTGMYEGEQLVVGNERLMARYGIDIQDVDLVGSVVHVAYDGGYVGAVHIADELKLGVENLADQLKAAGAKAVVMLTGDQNKIAGHVASELKIDHYYSELMPEDKLNHVEAMLDEGRHVLFVGDGINDAPVLARADIGVAMGGLGSDAAIEAADIVLMTDEPGKLLEAKAIAKKTRIIVMQNIVFALGVKLFFLTLGAIGIATMYEAIFADVGVATIAVLNSMRILKK